MTDHTQGETAQGGDLQHGDHPQRLLHQQGPQEHLRQGEGDEEEVQVLGRFAGEDGVQAGSGGEGGGGEVWLRHQR